MTGDGTPKPKLITRDAQGRFSLGKVGRPEHTRYLVEVADDGTMVLTPAVAVPVSTVAR